MGDAFSLDISRFAEKAGANVETVIRKAATDLLTGVVNRTPVGLPELWAINIARKAKGLPLYKPAGYVGGRLRANWNVSIENPDLSTSEKTDKDGTVTIAKGRSRLSRVRADQDIYIMNSLPYVRRIEYDAWSSQAPAGMVRITVTEFQTMVNKAVAELPK